MRNKFITFLLIVAVLFGALGTLNVRAQDTTLLIWADDTRAPILEALAVKFKEEFGVDVKVQQLGFGDIRSQVKTASPAGEGPDIFVGAHDWIGELSKDGLLEPLDLGELAEKFTQASLDGFTYEGVLYGMPYAVENVAFVYNPEIVTEVPKDFEEVRKLSEELMKSGVVKYGFVRQSGDPYHFFPIQTAFGGYVFGFEEGVGYNPNDLGIDSEGSIAALKWFEGMVKDGLQPAGVDYDVMHTLFTNKEAAMIITGPWALGDRLRPSGVPYKIAPIPGGGRPFLGVQGFMINAFSKNKELAKTFLFDFIAAEDIEVTAVGKDGVERTGIPMVLFGFDRPSAFLPALEKLEDPDLIAFGEAGVNGLAMPAIPEMASVWQAWGNAIEAVANQQVSAEEAFKTAAEQIRNLLK